jgi:hypothetical protein
MKTFAGGNGFAGGNHADRAGFRHVFGDPRWPLFQISASGALEARAG